MGEMWSLFLVPVEFLDWLKLFIISMFNPQNATILKNK